MGMAASQCNFGMLTRRKHDIGVSLERCSMEKTNLTREMRKVTQNYQNALNTKTLKWSNNSGITYVDLSYSNLMRPCNANQNKPYLITNSYGNIIVDDEYKKYAEMISPDGKPGGDWESNRTKILASLIPDLTEEQINNSVTTSNTVATAREKVEKLRNETDNLYNQCTQTANKNNFVATCFGSVSGFSCDGQTASNNIGTDYNNATTQWSLGNTDTGAKSQLKNLTDQIKNNVKIYLSDEDFEAFEKAADSTYDIYSNYVESADEQNKDLPMSIDSNSKNYVINVSTFINCLLEKYKNNGGRVTESENNSSIDIYSYVNKESTQYTSYQAKKEELKQAEQELADAINNDNQSLTADQENVINFYDQLFSAIAEKGWSYNAQINDNEYINNMLQNNQFYITTMDLKEDEEGNNYYEYDQNFASNFDKIISVNDKNVQEEALTKYEYEKSIINEKETRVDTRMKNLETEQSSINKMLEGIKTVRNDNIERTFSIEA